jgi:hypothetical protein
LPATVSPEADALEVYGVVLARVMPVQRDRLIGDHARRTIGDRRIYPMSVEIGFGAGNEKSTCLVQPKQSGEIDVPTVHDINGASFRHQHIERMHIVHLAVGNMDKARDVATQI